MHGTQSLNPHPLDRANVLSGAGLVGSRGGAAYGEVTAIAPGAIGRLSHLCDHANKLQDHACKISAVLEEKVSAMHGPRPTAQADGPNNAKEAGGFDCLALKLQALEGFLARLALLANQI